MNKAADALRVGSLSAEDESVIENWRASHGVVLNTFRQTLNRHAAGKDIIVAQRLKRRKTIYDKLSRQPNMSLARMQDIAGCRLIFSNVGILRAFREVMHRSRFRHTLKNQLNDYDYITTPKSTGYSGIHDVYQYRSFSGLEKDALWDGLFVEIQYRTLPQHSWATAVEIYDLVRGLRTKYSESDTDTLEFFTLASEIIARYREQMNGPRPDLSSYEVAAAINQIRKRLDIIDILGKFPPLETNLGVFGIKSKYAVMVLRENSAVEIISCGNSVSLSIEQYFELEKKYPDDDVVLVHAEGVAETRNAFRNYFRDSHDFIHLVLDGIINFFDEKLKDANSNLTLGAK